MKMSEFYKNITNEVYIMQLWKIRPTGVSKVPAAEFTDSETEIRCVDLDPSGNIAVSGSDDGTWEEV